jgi:pSer/pThr/pTyr-binding forkhead associated (FHA) protein
MPKLVVLSPEQKGRSYELKLDKTTIGRVDDNTFQIAESSVSSHHCEVLLRGSEVLIKDLNSTNGTFINNEKISESVLKAGQTLRLGQIELKLDTGDSTTTPAIAAAMSSPASAPTQAAAAAKKSSDQTVVMKRGVSLNELEQGTRTAGFDTSTKGFAKKSNKTNVWFLVAGIAIVVIVGIGFLIILAQLRK